MAGLGTKLLQFIAPKKKGKAGGVTMTPTHQPNNSADVLPAPRQQDHLVDIFQTRLSDDANTLMQFLAKNDPDVSAAFNAYLTVSNTEPMIFVHDLENNLDRDGMKIVQQLLTKLTRQIDYTLGFQLKPSLRAYCESFRFMLLLRGACMAEMVMDKQLIPENLRLIDPLSVDWYEEKPGEYKPEQQVQGSDKGIDLDIPTFFVSFFRRDPTKIYTTSAFVSAINTISARQQIINDLYRIAKVTGWPRIDLSVVEEVVVKTAPANVKANQDLLRQWINTRMTEITSQFAQIRADQAFVHTDTVEAKILNEKAGVSVNLDSVIETLNAQNQAGLKTVSTLLGRGDGGVNTASVETRVFSMNADELNYPVAEMLSNMLTLALQLMGRPSIVTVEFRKAELRPELELEPQKVMKQTRLLEALSRGLVTDDEFHIQMFGRPRPDASPELSGTGFMDPPEPARADVSSVSPNADAQGRSVSAPGRKNARSNRSGGKKLPASVELALAYLDAAE